MRISGGGCLVGVGVPFPGPSYGEAGLSGEQDSRLEVTSGTHGFAGGQLLFQAGCAGRTDFLSKKTAPGCS